MTRNPPSILRIAGLVSLDWPSTEWGSVLAASSKMSTGPGWDARYPNLARHASTSAITASRFCSARGLSASLSKNLGHSMRTLSNVSRSSRRLMLDGGFAMRDMRWSRISPAAAPDDVAFLAWDLHTRSPRRWHLFMRTPGANGSSGFDRHIQSTHMSSGRVQRLSPASSLLTSRLSISVFSGVRGLPLPAMQAPPYFACQAGLAAFIHVGLADDIHSLSCFWTGLSMGMYPWILWRMMLHRATRLDASGSEEVSGRRTLLHSATSTDVGSMRIGGAPLDRRNTTASLKMFHSSLRERQSRTNPFWRSDMRL